MWIALACQSLLQPDEVKIKERIKTCYPYIIIGAVLFALIYVSIPEKFRGFLGMLGGLMVGFSATYKWQTVFNSFGALVVAVPIFGLGLTVFIRVFDNIFGSIYSNIFNKAFNKIYERFTKEKSMSQAV